MSKVKSYNGYDEKGSYIVFEGDTKRWYDNTIKGDIGCSVKSNAGDIEHISLSWDEKGSYIVFEGDTKRWYDPTNNKYAMMILSGELTLDEYYSKYGTSETSRAMLSSIGDEKDNTIKDSIECGVKSNTGYIEPVRLSWDEYFIAMADLASIRSKDPNTKVGAVIVDSENSFVSMGYNGLPKYMDDESFDWNDRENKYPYVVHAEQNAIAFSKRSIEGCRIYVTLFPCSTCAKLIVQSGIVEVIYGSDKYIGTPDNKASKKILAGIKTRAIDPILVAIHKGVL